MSPLNYLAILLVGLALEFSAAVIFLGISKYRRKPVSLQLTITGGNNLKLTEQAQASVQEFDGSGAIVANGSIIYSSSDNRVVTISDTGLITPVAAGTATITATDGANGLTDSKAVTVEAVVTPVATRLVLTISAPFPAANPPHVAGATGANLGDAEPVS